MRLLILAAGKAKAGPEKALFETYAQRLPQPPLLIEIEEKRPLSSPERKTKEAELLLAKLPEGAFAVALDARGKTLSSEDFAKKLAGWRDQGRDLAFLIGGADGHGEAVLVRADLKLSLGPMTWPHMLVRVLLAEQLWRAHSLNTGHPYHRG